MKIISTNKAKPTTIRWNGQDLTTGIFKNPTVQPIFLGKETVVSDEVSDRKVHGGEFKACYLFSAEQYPYWKNLYPNLNWNYGMFGENLTVSGLDETQVQIGSIYKVGTALVQITQPREPCYKFGVKFGDQNILKQFIEHGFPGTYVRVVEEGIVKTGDDLTLVETAENSLSVFEFFKLLFAKEKNQTHIERAVKNDALPLKKRIKLEAFLN
jgi:MOSC domain-containing protein YiiM